MAIWYWLARWLEPSFPNLILMNTIRCVIYHSTRQCSYFQNNLSSKENMVQFFRNQGQRSKNIFYTKIHWIPNFNYNAFFIKERRKIVYLVFYLKRRMSYKNNCSVQIYVFSLKTLVIFQTVDSKAIKAYPNVKKI